MTLQLNSKSPWWSEIKKITHLLFTLSTGLCFIVTGIFGSWPQRKEAARKSIDDKLSRGAGVVVSKASEPCTEGKEAGTAAINIRGISLDSLE
jgi:hypothetical protein